MEHHLDWCLMRKAERMEGDPDVLAKLCRRGISRIYTCRYCRQASASSSSRGTETKGRKFLVSGEGRGPWPDVKGIWIAGKDGLEMFSTDDTDGLGALAAFLFENMEEGSKLMNMGKVYGGSIVSPSNKLYLADAGYAVVMCRSDGTMPIGMLRKVTLEVAKEVGDGGL